LKNIITACFHVKEEETRSEGKFGQQQSAPQKNTTPQLAFFLRPGSQNQDLTLNLNSSPLQNCITTKRCFALQEEHVKEDHLQNYEDGDQSSTLSFENSPEKSKINPR
jgi:hypothetical protein